MPGPHRVHRLERSTLCLRHEERDEQGHHHDPTGIIREDVVLELAQHGEEELGLKEGAEKTDSGADTVTGGPNFNQEYLTGDEPVEWAPQHTDTTTATL